MPILELNRKESVIRKFLRWISTRVRASAATAEALPVGVCEPPPCAGNESCAGCDDAVRERLAAEVAALEQLDSERARYHDFRLGKLAEDRIVWGELIDLELQDIDEQVSRIIRATGAKPRAALESHVRPGDCHGSNQS